MIHLYKILTEQDTDFDKERTEDSLSKPKDKLNVLFIGDADTHSQVSYAKDILNSGVVTGNIVSTAEGDITKVLSLLQTNVAGNYDIISLMFSNIVPNDKVSAVEVLKVMFNSIEDAGSKLIAISPPTKEFAPYGHVKYASTPEIANWINTQQTSDFTIDAYTLTDNKALFQKNKILLNKEGHEIIAKQWLEYLAEIDPKIDPNILSKKDAQKQSKGAESDIKLFKQGDKSPKLSILQQRLTSLEYTINATETKSGTFGDTTYQAVRTFQTINEMPVTGYIDENTARAILNPKARAFSKWASMFSSVLPDFMKNLFGDKEDKEQNIFSTAFDSISQDYKNYKHISGGSTINRKAFLDATAWAEGTSQYPNDGYYTLFTGKQFNSLAKHPNISICAQVRGRQICSTAAGRYGFLSTTWKGLGFSDFSRESQDKGALMLLSPKLLAAVDSGDWPTVFRGANGIWASFPGDVYNQGGKTMDQMMQYIEKRVLELGGKVEDNVSDTAATTTSKPLGKSIAIGDSLTPNVARSAGITAAPGLWKSGITVEQLLNNHVKPYTTKDPAVKNVVICIGTNGIYRTSSNTVTELVKQLRAKFPNAKLFVVKGTYGPKATWSKPLTTVDSKTVATYYSYFANNGVTIIPTAIGNQKDAHAYTDIYNTIGSEIRSRLS
jgi:muramidase (phage lysozyme)